MGIPVLPPEYSSLECSYCFDAGTCPLHIYAAFNGIKKCVPGDPFTEAPNGVLFTLTRNPSAYCYWCSDMGTSWYAEYASSNSSSALTLKYGPPPGFLAFGQTIYIKCQTSFINQASCSYPSSHWYSGTGTAYLFPDTIPPTLCDTMGLHPGESNLYHKTPTIENLADYRLANRRDKTNVLCRVCTPIVGRENDLLEFTGVLSPDSTGDFEEVCTYAGQPYYRNSGNGWFLWWDSINELWVVSALLGVPGTAYWTSADKISASYLPHGTASGTGDMHAHP